MLILSLVAAVVALGLPFDQAEAAVVLGGAWIVGWGLVDDYRGLSVPGKLVVQLSAALLVMLMGIQVRLFELAWLNYLLTLLWLVGLMNAFNFVDSMDGLALGLAGVAAAFFMLVTIDSQQVVLSQLSAALFGATLGAFLFNAAPARLFLGDSGSQFLGLTLASIGVAYSPIGLHNAVSWFVPIAVLGVPIFDTVLVVLSRLRRGRPVHQAGHDHTYHRLVQLGLHPYRAVISMQLSTICLGLVAFLTLRTSVLTANLIWSSIVLLGALTVLVLERRIPLKDEQ